MNIEKQLCDIHHKECAYLVGSATIGIYLTLKALGLRHKRVAIPNSICPNVPLAILYSDNDPLFLDISKKDLGLSLTELQEHVTDLDVVLANHSYGSVCDIERIKEFCRVNDKMLIEDMAVAQGAKTNNLPVGSFGDVSIVSFGAGKIVSVGHGGAILSNDHALIKEVALIEKSFKRFSKQSEKKIDQIADYFKNMYNKYYGTKYWEEGIRFYDFAESSKDSFMTRFPTKNRDELGIKLNKLEQNIQRRKENAETLRTHFNKANNEYIETVIPSDGSVYWRFNILVSRKRNDLLKYMLNKKFQISSWYPSVSSVFSNVTKSDLKVRSSVSDSISDSILNIWVDEEVDREYLENVVNEIVYFCDNK